MRFIKMNKASCHDEHERFEMVIGREEANILSALLEKASVYIPHTDHTHTTIARVRQMRRAINDAVKTPTP